MQAGNTANRTSTLREVATARGTHSKQSNPSPVSTYTADLFASVYKRDGQTGTGRSRAMSLAPNMHTSNKRRSPQWTVPRVDKCSTNPFGHDSRDALPYGKHRPSAEAPSLESARQLVKSARIDRTSSSNQRTRGAATSYVSRTSRLNHAQGRHGAAHGLHHTLDSRSVEPAAAIGGGARNAMSPTEDALRRRRSKSSRRSPLQSTYARQASHAQRNKRTGGGINLSKFYGLDA